MPSLRYRDMEVFAQLTIRTSLFFHQVRGQNLDQAMAYKYEVEDLQEVRSDRNVRCRYLCMLSHRPRLKLHLKASHELKVFQ